MELRKRNSFFIAQKESEVELVKLKIGDIKPYKNNPRYNDEAVDAVAESIQQVGYISPIVVDENNEILCGHTRLKALYAKGEKEVECIRIKGRTDEQKRKFRLLDNKTAELATWDLPKLKTELEGLDFGDFDFFSKEIEKMADKMLNEKKKLIICPRCGKVVIGMVNMDEYDE
jgi:disulfide oxidoreductase YuzD